MASAEIPSLVRYAGATTILNLTVKQAEDMRDQILTRLKHPDLSRSSIESITPYNDCGVTGVVLYYSAYGLDGLKLGRWADFADLVQ